MPSLRQRIVKAIMNAKRQAGLENEKIAFDDRQYAKVLRHAMDFARQSELWSRKCMTKDYRQSLLTKREHLDREIADAESQMNETIPFNDWRRLSNLLAILRLSREELQIELDGLGHAKANRLEDQP